jgi:hypothetical protein
MPSLYRLRWAQEEIMLCVRTLFSVALLVPFLATLLPAQAAKMDVRAARAECFRKANEAANAARVNLVPAVLPKGRLLEWTPIVRAVAN